MGLEFFEPNVDVDLHVGDFMTKNNMESHDEVD